jgi:hypothetical protein
MRDVARNAPVEERLDVLQRVAGLGLCFDGTDCRRHVGVGDLVEGLAPVEVLGEQPGDLCFGPWPPTIKGEELLPRIREGWSWGRLQRRAEGEERFLAGVSQTERRIMPQPYLRAAWLFEHDPCPLVRADAKSERRRAQVHVKARLQCANGNVSEG